MPVKGLPHYGSGIAVVVDGRGREGYLRVKAFEWHSKDDSGLSYDLELIVRDGVDWDFSDRADPEPDDVVAELAAGRVSWWGGDVVVESWLSDGSAAADEAVRLFPDHTEPR